MIAARRHHCSSGSARHRDQHRASRARAGAAGRVDEQLLPQDLPRDHALLAARGRRGNGGVGGRQRRAQWHSHRGGRNQAAGNTVNDEYEQLCMESSRR